MITSQTFLRAVCIQVILASTSVGQVVTELINDDFVNGFDDSVWFVRPWTPDGATYIDGTQLRVAPYQPPVSNGFLNLTFSTYNPSATAGDSFYGAEIVSVQAFSPTVENAIKLSSRARIRPPSGSASAPSGIVTSMFLYKLLSPSSRNEIDIELLTKSQSEGPGVLTNSFVEDPFSAEGDAVFVPIDGFDATTFHDFEILFEAASITWLVDGRVIRRETESVPAGDLHLHFNIWAPLFGGFHRAIDPSLKPASSLSESVDVIWQLDFARVESVSGLSRADFNFDLLVDGEDLHQWEHSFGTDGFADTDGDNDTDGNDFLKWQQSFGQIAAREPPVKVPEPSPVALMLLAALTRSALRQVGGFTTVTNRELLDSQPVFDRAG